VACAPGQADLTACNEELAAQEKDKEEQGRDREMEGVSPR
jgi:hypothetical protein